MISTLLNFNSIKKPQEKDIIYYKNEDEHIIGFNLKNGVDPRFLIERISCIKYRAKFRILYFKEFFSIAACIHLLIGKKNRGNSFSKDRGIYSTLISSPSINSLMKKSFVPQIILSKLISSRQNKFV